MDIDNNGVKACHRGQGELEGVNRGLSIIEIKKILVEVIM